MDRGAGVLFEPVADGADLCRVNLGGSVATVAHAQALFDEAGLETSTYRTGDGEGVNPSSSTILLFRAADLETARSILADVAAEATR